MHSSLKLRFTKNISKNEYKQRDKIQVKYKQMQYQTRNDQLANQTKPIYVIVVQQINQGSRQQVSKIQEQMWNKLKKVFSNKIQNEPEPTCQICLQNLGPKNSVQLCNCPHLYCQSCVTQYLNARIKAFQIIKCLDENCASQLDQQSTIYSSLPKQTKLKYQKIKRFYFVTKNPDYKLCPKESCPGLVNTKKKPCTCDKCSQKYCPKCLLKDHWGKCQNESIVYLQKNLNYIQCSHCNFIIEKNEGCDHITCKCGYQLCYKCGGVWKGPKHMCVRSKWFQKARSLMFWLMQRTGLSVEFSWARRMLNLIGMVLLNSLYVNLVLAVILTVVETIYNVIMWISPFSYVKSYFSSEEKLAQVKETIPEQESGFPFFWVYLSLVFVSWLIVRRFVRNYKMKYFLMIVAAVTGVVYFLSNLFLVFYYEYLFVSYILENIFSIICGGLSLLGIVFLVRIFTQQKRRMKGMRGMNWN